MADTTRRFCDVDALAARLKASFALKQDVADVALPYSVNVLDYGLVADGETDNLEAFNALYEAHPYETLYFPQGTYLFSGQITVGLAHLFLDRATLKWSAECDYAIYMTGYLPGEPEMGDDDFTASMNVINGHKPTYGNFITGRGWTIDCDYKAASGIYVGTQRAMDISFGTIHNFSAYGVHQPAISYTNSSGETAYFSFELNCHNLLIDNDYDDEADDCLSSTGIYMNGDGTIRDVVMVNAHTGIVSGGANVISNVHAWMYDFKSTKDYQLLSGSVFYRGGADVLSDCYIDTYETGLYIWGNGTRVSNLGWFINSNTWDYSLSPKVLSVADGATFVLFGARIAANASETFLSGTPGKYVATGLMITGSGCSDAVDTFMAPLDNAVEISATLSDGTTQSLTVPVVSSSDSSSSSEVACQSISANSFNDSTGITVSSTTTATTASVLLSPSTVTDELAVTSSDEGVVTVGDITYSETSYGKKATVQLSVVAIGSATLTFTCGSQSLSTVMTVASGLSAATTLPGFDATANALVAQLDLSTCSNAQENVLYVGSEAGASGWSSMQGTGCMYMYYYKDTKKLEMDCCYWQAVKNSSSRYVTLSESQASDVKVTVDSTGVTVTSGETTLLSYAYDADSTFWSGLPSDLYVGYGQDSCPSNATYADGWLTLDGSAVEI